MRSWLSPRSLRPRVGLAGAGLSLVVAVSITLITACSQTQNLPAHDSSLDPYIAFLESHHESARDYILGLFDDHDIVVLCERDHRDITQYDLYLSIIRDERFIKNVGNVFTEIGVSNQNPAINEFLHSEGLSEDSAKSRVLFFQRNASWLPVWEMGSFSALIRTIHDVNQGLPSDQKVNFYSSGMPFDWSTTDSASLAAFNATLPRRDRILADKITTVFDRIRESDAPRKKALVIMNYRHGFNRHFERPEGLVRDNVGGYLSEHYGDRMANVYVNFIRVTFDSAGTLVPMAVNDGRWDAAFKVSGIGDAGFDFKGSPFGSDRFDIWPGKIEPLNFEDMFTGMVYYVPPDKMKPTVGLPGLVDSAFLPELMRREHIQRLVKGGDGVLDADSLMQEYNDQRVVLLNGLDSIMVQIDHWLN